MSVTVRWRAIKRLGEVTLEVVDSGSVGISVKVIVPKLVG